ncbi:MAG: hypothetical protein K2P81_00125 [Bacteriovoracaceae bacterium]|nr:hypothetical protein [Bacteriovoracaceae bacterium]
MKFIILLLFIFGCSSPVPTEDTDIPFCKEDTECTLYRSKCGKVKAFNVKYSHYVENEFKKREEKMECENFPDTRRYGVRCEMNACVLVQR